MGEDVYGLCVGQESSITLDVLTQSNKRMCSFGKCHEAESFVKAVNSMDGRDPESRNVVKQRPDYLRALEKFGIRKDLKP